MIIYSEQGRAIGATRKSPCGCMTELVIQTEPWRTQLAGVMCDYALESPFKTPDTYRLDTLEDGRMIVKAKSMLQEGLWVDVAEITLDEEGMPVLSLLRIRPQYKGRRTRHHAKRTAN